MANCMRENCDAPIHTTPIKPKPISTDEQKIDDALKRLTIGTGAA